MAVLADAGADDVGRLGEQDVLVDEAGLQGRSALLAGDQAEAVVGQADQAEQVLLQVAAERGGVFGTQAEVLVHVEADDPRPVDPLGGDQRGEELVLARRGGEDDVDPIGLGLPPCDGLRHVRRGGPAHLGPVLVDDHPQGIDREFRDRPGLGQAHGGSSSQSWHRRRGNSTPAGGGRPPS